MEGKTHTRKKIGKRKKKKCAHAGRDSPVQLRLESVKSVGASSGRSHDDITSFWLLLHSHKVVKTSSIWKRACLAFTVSNTAACYSDWRLWKLKPKTRNVQIWHWVLASGQYQATSVSDDFQPLY